MVIKTIHNGYIVNIGGLEIYCKDKIELFKCFCDRWNITLDPNIKFIEEQNEKS